jgi:predicted metal-dependent RNase
VEGKRIREVPINLGVYDCPLSAHAGRHELFTFIENMNPATMRSKA